MGYSIMDTGRQHRAQSTAIFSELAREEAQRNATNDQIKAQDEASQSSTMGTMAGMGLAADIDRYSAAQSAIPDAAGGANVASGGGQVISDAAVSESLGLAGGETGANAAIGGGQIITDAAVAESGATALAAEGATAAGTTAIGAGAGTTAAAGAAASASAAAGGVAASGGAAAGAQTGAALGPWGALAGLAIGYLASNLF